MSYIMVTADFPGVTLTQRNAIYKCLTDKSWTKVSEPGRDIDTVWYAAFKDEVSEAAAKRTTKSEFEACCDKICTPKLAIHWGPNIPSFYNLV